MTRVTSLAIGALFVVLYGVYRRRDRRLLRNGVFLVAAAWFLLSGASTLLATVSPAFGLVVVLLVGLAPLAVVVLAVFAIANGVTVIRAEGLSLATSLSLLAGLALLVLPVVGVLLFLSRDPFGIGAAALLFLLSGYGGVVFVVFLVYSVVYGRTALQTRPAALVILGSRIIDGRVPPLLRSRLDRALTLYRRGRPRGALPCSSPAAARATTRRARRGRPWPSTSSPRASTPPTSGPRCRPGTPRENLLLSAAVQQEAGRPGPALAVTNNYHVLRAAILARELGSDTQVVGSPTARYYVPSAFLREFVAVVVEHRRLHLLLVLPFAALIVVGMVAAYGGR